MSNWGYSGPVTIAHQDGYTVKIAQWNGVTASDTPRNASLFMPDGHPATIDENGYPSGDGVDNGPFPPFTGANVDSPEQGTASGWIQGNNINITVEWLDLNPKVASANVYTGTIDANGVASGSCLNTQNRIRTNWHIVEHFAQRF
jgi:hypothetical protein